MAGGAAWAGNEERCTRGWTDCSDCSVSRPGAEGAVKDHNIEGFRDFNEMLHHISKVLEMGITIYFCLCNSGVHQSLTLLIFAGVGCVRRGGAVVVTAGGSWAGCCVAAPVMGMFWTEMPCGVMWWI